MFLITEIFINLKLLKMLNILFWLIIFVGISVSNQKEDTFLSHTGLALIKENDILLSGDSWTIVFVMNSSDIMQNSISFDKELSNIEASLFENNLSNNIYLKELDGIKLKLSSLLTVSKSVTDISGTSPIDLNEEIEETTMKSRPLFRAQTTTDMDRLGEIVFDSMNEVNAMKTFQYYQMSVTNLLNVKLKENVQKFANLSQTRIIDEIKRISRLEVGSASELTEQQNEFFTNFRMLETIVSDSIAIVEKLQKGMEMAAEGKFSFSLISIKELKNLLTMASGVLPDRTKLLLGLRADDINKYGDIFEVTSMVHGDLIMIINKMPLSSVERSFLLYRAVSLPVEEKTTGQIFRVRPDGKYLLVGKDKKYYALLNEEDIHICKGVSPKICPSTINLTVKHLPTCLSSIFYNDLQMIEKTCKKFLLIKQHRPIWIADKYHKGWIYSVAKPTKITLKCLMNSTTVLEIFGTNILNNVSHCNVYGQDFKLFRTDGDISLSNVEYTLSTIKPSGPLLTKTILELLLNRAGVDKAVEELRKQGFVKMGLAHSEEVSLDMLVCRLQDHDSSQNYQNNWKLVLIPAFVSLMVSVACCYLVLYCDKNHIIGNVRTKFRSDRNGRRKSIELEQEQQLK